MGEYATDPNFLGTRFPQFISTSACKFVCISHFIIEECYVVQLKVKGFWCNPKYSLSFVAMEEIDHDLETLVAQEFYQREFGLACYINLHVFLRFWSKSCATSANFKFFHFLW